MCGQIKRHRRNELILYDAAIALSSLILNAQELHPYRSEAALVWQLISQEIEIW